MAQTQRKPHKSGSRMHYIRGRSDKPFTQPPARLVFPSPVSAPRQNCGSVRCLLWIMFDTMPGPMKRAEACVVRNVKQVQGEPNPSACKAVSNPPSKHVTRSLTGYVKSKCGVIPTERPNPLGARQIRRLAWFVLSRK